MPISTGTLKTISSKGFQVKFTDYTYTGIFASEMSPFASDNVFITYNSTDQFTGWQVFSGVVGTDAFDLVFTPGVTMVGVLTSKMSPKSKIAGTGFWSKSGQVLEVSASLSSSSCSNVYFS
ncbi:hypothetical protein BD779DRAFT_1457462 [Infundibulicybe gibba]|nr:hypothetical protein BD779DRAFT_1457462 [Infundibulicybe gibba]